MAEIQKEGGMLYMISICATLAILLSPLISATLRKLGSLLSAHDSVE